MPETKSCVIIGAGLSGLTAAASLCRSGWDVTLLDKGHGAGGRMATRVSNGAKFDTGAQFFTVRDPRFEAEVRQWLKSGWVRPWFQERGHTRYCGTDGMRGLAACLARPFDCRTSNRVTRLEPADGGWRILSDDAPELRAHSVLLTAPAPQSLELLAGCTGVPDRLLCALRTIAFDPCFAVLVSLDGPSRVPAPGFVRPGSGPIAFIADNTQKGLSASTALTIHATPAFSRSCADTPREDVIAALLDAAKPWFGSPVLDATAHFWKYSQPCASQPCKSWNEPCLFSAEPAPLTVAGDAFAGPRIEGAFLSGLAAARRITAVL